LAIFPNGGGDALQSRNFPQITDFINHQNRGGWMKSLRYIIVIALAVLVSAPAFAQGTTGTLTGTVTTGGNPLPGATITVSSPRLLGTRTAVSGANGDYNIPALPPGDYSVAFDLEGMQRITKKTQLTLAETTR